MSLLQLLSVSHSFKETTDRPGTYRLGTRHMLPPFEGMRNTASHREPARTVHTAAESESSLFSELVAAPEQRKRLAARHDMMNADSSKPLSPWLTRRSNWEMSEQNAKSANEERTRAVNGRASAMPRGETPAVPGMKTRAVVEKVSETRNSELKSSKQAEQREVQPRHYSARTTGLPLPITPLHRPKTSWFGKLVDYFTGGKNKKVSSYQYQASHSIESVRVVRNDLSDSDLDVVSRNAKESAATSPSVPEGSLKKGWKGLTGRVFQRNKNVFQGRAPREEQGELIAKP